MSKKNKVRDARFSSRPPPPNESPDARPTSMRPAASPPKGASLPPRAATPSPRNPARPPARPSPVEPEPSPFPAWLNASLLVPAIMILGASGALFVWYRDTHPSPVAAVSTVADAAVSADAAAATPVADAAAVVLPPPAVDAAAAAPTDAAAVAHTLTGDPVEPTHPTPSSPDPRRGVFTVAQATEGLGGSGALVAEIETSMGTFTCDLLQTEAPLTVANFVGLARGKRDFWDPVAGAWARRPFYDGSIFHRVIPRFMIQGGDVLRSGFGGTGYEIRDENVNGHDAAGQLCMANHGPNTNGGQFFITEGPTTSLDGSYSIFGRCRPTALVGTIARTPVAGERPTSPVFIEHVRVRRAIP